MQTIISYVSPVSRGSVLGVFRNRDNSMGAPRDLDVYGGFWSISRVTRSITVGFTVNVRDNTGS